MISKNLTYGEYILVEVYNYKLKKSEWLPGIFVGYKLALDKIFRCDVRLDNGLEFDAAAPECIKKA